MNTNETKTVVISVKAASGGLNNFQNTAIASSPVSYTHLPAGLDLIVIILIAAPLTYFIGDVTSPVVNGVLNTVGSVLTEASNSSPVLDVYKRQ